MGVEYLGLNSLFTSILQVLNLAELGVGSAMVYSMYKPIAENDKSTICALLKLYKKYYFFIGLIIACVGALLTSLIPKLISGDIPGQLNVYILYLLNLAATVMTYWLFAYKNSLIMIWHFLLCGLHRTCIKKWNCCKCNCSRTSCNGNAWAQGGRYFVYRLYSGKTFCNTFRDWTTGSDNG